MRQDVFSEANISGCPVHLPQNNFQYCIRCIYSVIVFIVCTLCVRCMHSVNLQSTRLGLFAKHCINFKSQIVCKCFKAYEHQVPNRVLALPNDRPRRMPVKYSRTVQQGWCSCDNQTILHLARLWRALLSLSLSLYIYIYIYTSIIYIYN